MLAPSRQFLRGCLYPCSLARAVRLAVPGDIVGGKRGGEKGLGGRGLGAGGDPRKNDLRQASAPVSLQEYLIWSCLKTFPLLSLSSEVDFSCHVCAVLIPPPPLDSSYVRPSFGLKNSVSLFLFFGQRVVIGGLPRVYAHLGPALQSRLLSFTHAIVF